MLRISVGKDPQNDSITPYKTIQNPENFPKHTLLKARGGGGKGGGKCGLTLMRIPMGSCK